MILICYHKESDQHEFKCITIPLSFHHVSPPPLCFPSTLSLTFSFLSFLISALKNSLPPHLVLPSLKTQIRLISTPFHIPDLSAICRGVCTLTAWLLCHQGSAFVPVATVSAPQLGAPNPQVLLIATLLLVLPYCYFLNSISEVWISNIQLGPKVSDRIKQRETAA